MQQLLVSTFGSVIIIIIIIVIIIIIISEVSEEKITLVNCCYKYYKTWQYNHETPNLKMHQMTQTFTLRSCYYQVIVWHIKLNHSKNGVTEDNLVKKAKVHICETLVSKVPYLKHCHILSFF